MNILYQLASAFSSHSLEFLCRVRK